MSFTSNTQEFRLEAADAIYGPSECRSWLFTADSSSDTNNGYIDVNYTIFTSNGLEEVLGYIWFNVGGAGVDPAPAGKTLVAEAAYAADADAETRVDAIISALDALSTNPFSFYKKIGTDTLFLDNAYPNEQTTETETSANATLTVLRDGFGNVFDGTSEGITVSVESTLFDVTSNQTGELVRDRIIQGFNVSASASFLDVSQSAKEALVGKGAGDIVDLGGGKKAVGHGQSRLFQNVSEIGGRLIFHPIRLDRSDRSADFVIWNTLPVLNELAFDGTSLQTLSMHFSANLDQQFDSRINLFVMGEEWIDNDLIA